MSEKFVKGYGDAWKGFKSEDGKHYRTSHADFSNIIEHNRYLNEAVNESTVMKKKGYQHIGSIPTVLLEDWLTKNGYTMHDFAINAGGDKDKSNPYGGGGVKDKFLKYFLSRDFNKLHNM